MVKLTEEFGSEPRTERVFERSKLGGLAVNIFLAGVLA
jgi:hypothetical protein